MIETVAAISDDIERMLAAHRLLREIEDMNERVAAIRRAVVLKLYDVDGWDDPRIAELLGITKQQVGRIRRAATEKAAEAEDAEGPDAS